MSDENEIVVVRHALAGRKLPDPAADYLRQLDASGRASAAALPAVLLRHLVPSEIVSSPSVRCTETVAPLAEHVGLALQTEDALLPTTPRQRIVELVLGLSDGAVVCTHGEVITSLLDGLDCEKGALWIVRREADMLLPLRYVPPPALPPGEGELAGSADASHAYY